MYKCKFFKLYELVDEDTYLRWGEFAWNFLDQRMLIGMDKLREDLDKPITINNWKQGGQFQWRGLRTAKYYKGKVAYSQHLFGRAVDFDVKGMTAEQVREYIRINHAEYNIRCIEAEVNWVHADWRNCEPLKEVSP